MLDDLRNSSGSGYEEEQSPKQEELAPRRPERPPFLGMTAAQRFTIVFMIFLMVLVLGAFCLVAFNKVSLPF